MSVEQVWYRFEAKRKDGIVCKLRIQDLPLTRINDALDMVVNIFRKDEPLSRASGVATNTANKEMYRKYWENNCFRNPSVTTVICCSDDTPDVKKLMGLSIVSLISESTTSIEQAASQSPSATVKNEEIPQERKKLGEILKECLTAYDPAKELNLNVYYEDKGLVVDPDYRGLGIAKNFLKVRRLICKAHGVPMTGAWMTAFGTQKAGDRDGWETVKEIEYDYLAKKYNVSFTDVPRTMKYMIVRIDNTDSSI